MAVVDVLKHTEIYDRDLGQANSFIIFIISRDFLGGDATENGEFPRGKVGLQITPKKFEPIAHFSRCARRCSLAKRILIVKTSFGTSGLNNF